MSETPGGTAIAPPNISPFHKRAFPCASMSGCRTSSCPRSESTAPASHSSKDPSLDELAPPTWCSAMASGPRRRNAAAAAALRRWRAAFAGPAAPTMSSSAMPHIRPTDRPRAHGGVVTCHSLKQNIRRNGHVDGTQCVHYVQRRSPRCFGHATDMHQMVQVCTGTRTIVHRSSWTYSIVDLPISHDNTTPPLRASLGRPLRLGLQTAPAS